MPRPTASADPLDGRPELGPPPQFKGLVPEVFRTEQGLTVWLIAKPALPLVSVALMVPTGSADDPPSRPGLAHIVADMLDEGAGSRGAIAISSAIEDLGAHLSTAARTDGSAVELTVLKKYLPQAFGIFADVAARPHFDPQELKRVSALWKDDLENRDKEPQAVARVVRAAVLYGPTAPYGHPTLGQMETATTVAAPELKDFYHKEWRPDRSVLVVAGDVARPEIEDLIKRDLSDWKAPTAPAPARVTPTEPLEKRPKLVLVDRPDAPQAVIDLVAPGVRAADPDAPLCDLVNHALGGSFTSRLNQNLREDHHWAYGAGSSFLETRGEGAFVAHAAVFVDAAAPALREMLAEIGKMRSDGVTEGELARARAKDVTDLIHTDETLSSLTSRLGELASLGLPPDYDQNAIRVRQQATRDALLGVAHKYLDMDKASVVVVGPRRVLEPELQVLGLGAPELWTPQGQPVK